VSVRRWWAWPLVPLYVTGLAVKDVLRAVGVLKVRSLAWPVISVGSLSAGGAGKTPVVIALAKLLRQRGWDVDVLTRGYGREGVGVERVGNAGEKQILRSAQDDNLKKNDTSLSWSDSARRFGDEPVLIARAANVPVWVGADRFAAGERAEEFVAREQEAGSSAAPRNDRKKNKDDDRKKNKGDDGEKNKDDGGKKNEDDDGRNGKGVRSVHLLDDGFQHRRLARAVNVVLITAEDLRDEMLPAGNLREPMTALRRADIVVIRQEEWKGVAAKVRELVGRGTLLWSVERTLRFPAPMGVLSAGLRPVAFCAIARPEGFGEMLHDAGCGVIETVAFGDHHSYSMEAIEHIIKVARGLRASGFVTTEKDAVKLSAEMLARLETVGPVVVVAMEAEFLNPAEVLSELEERLA
jgi:tetraacyldisaccharide 4'-kinase